jgi:hypothetical protein
VSETQFWRDSSQSLIFEMFRIPADQYAAISADIVEAFQLVPDNPPIVGLDSVFREYQRGEQSIDLAWDNWSGFFVTARNWVAESLVREIAEYLTTSSWVNVGQHDE